MAKPRRKPGDVGFYRGVIAALGALRAMCGATSKEYDVVVETFDLKELVTVARRGGDMKWSGLSEYLRWYRKQEF